MKRVVLALLAFVGLIRAGVLPAQTGTPSPHGSLELPCAECHRRDAWRPTRISKDFKHAAGRFALDGAHANVSCTSCHKRLDFTGVTSTCANCHRDAHHGELGADCARCHTTRSFLDQATMRRTHQTTAFPLVGVHAAVDCRSCHVPRAPGQFSFVNLPTTCETCHMRDYQRTADPPHAAASFSRSCNACHTPTKWTGAPFDHSTTKFALTGAHKAQTCTSCHADKVYVGKSMACVSCHQSDYQKTKTPPHALAAMSTSCENCHNTTAWPGASYDHSVTKFALTGAHKAQTCSSCHSDGVYVGKSVTCVSCHKTDFDKSTTPPHVAAGFPTTCETCHNTTAWPGAVFDHATTPFPLTGAHKAVNCTGCHADGIYKGKATTCISCHKTEYDQTKSPPHTAAGFPATCESCHNTTAWPGAKFDHSATKFPLTGAHLAATCQNCHGDGVYVGKSTLCASCHQSDYDKTSDPPHGKAGFSTACETCHSTTGWPGAVFDHSKTLFALTGAHLAVNCAGCHADGVYKGKPTTCVSCHQTQYAQTKNPPHSSAGFPATCELCHTTTNWTGAVFDHSKTFFPLTGSHLAVPCSGCHSDGVYKGKPTTCVSCHKPTYDQTKNPPHAAAGFPTSCEGCHTTASWLTATFNHSATLFPLTGAHTTIACSGCHSDGVYKGKPTTCVSCHIASYNGTTNPNHAGAGFPTTCETCHTTATWSGATFDHDATFFPIYSGAHRGTWSTCATCHTNPTNYAVFNCLSCHTKTQTDNQHKGRTGYVYASPNCYACHPRGRAG